VGLTLLDCVLVFCAMGRWTINPWRLVVLVSFLFLAVLILVLPDVDLPDTAFHRGTAPVDVHSRCTSAPGLLTVSTVGQLSFSAHPASRRREYSLLSSHTTAIFLPLLHRSLRC
jgi:hypothetical protein